MCTSELQASRNIYAKTVSKLQILESQLHANNQQKSPSKSSLQIPTEGSLSQNAISPPSFTTMSENGNDNERSCAGSWAATSISEISHFKGKNIEKSNKAEKENHLELMDDFLEMEKLASNDSNGAISGSDISNNMRSEWRTKILQSTHISILKNSLSWIRRQIMSLIRNCQYQIHNLILIHCP
ncbi:Filament-like plant protein 4 [Camellia lanceoleosa]|uniref:Filament-like plant protein 4 n=1 Tax=Camellia lanceoleosa TaxID=1840588 RepID=A0ACC0GW33_9ERIC|nr:Filament-like plant protein 4 [Camellia lanceoleosa]